VNTWKVILATMLIFGTGVVTGGLLVRHSEGTRNRHPQPHPAGAVRPAQPASPGVMRFDFLRRLERDLDLTRQQREPVDKILKDGQERMKKLMDTVEPRRREEYKKTIEEFRQVLTPEQRARFDELLKQQQQRAREQRKSGPPRERPAPVTPPGNSQPATNS
jgi:Spy/CpxP family protein refolding chaperone